HLSDTWEPDRPLGPVVATVLHKGFDLGRELVTIDRGLGPVHCTEAYLVVQRSEAFRDDRRSAAYRRDFQEHEHRYGPLVGALGRLGFEAETWHSGGGIYCVSVATPFNGGSVIVWGDVAEDEFDGRPSFS